MRLMPIVYSSAPSESVHLYEALGLRVARRARNEIWIELEGPAATLGIHQAGIATHGTVDLALVSDEPLEDTVARLRARGIEPLQGIQDDEFGRSIQVRDPGGVIVQINEHDEELYT